jgi:seryl-tRNA synthetase
MTRIVLALAALAMCSCATRPHTYQAPSPAHLSASTGRLNQAVTKAHDYARKAQGSVSDAAAMVKEVRDETAKLKEVPPTLIAKVNDLEQKLNEASNEQALLEVSLREADLAKVQVEKDKAEYFASAKKLADNATAENGARIKAEKALSWYRWHSWLLRIGAAVAVLVIIVLAFLWFTGRLAGLASKFL